MKKVTLQVQRKKNKKSISITQKNRSIKKREANQKIKAGAEAEEDRNPDLDQDLNHIEDREVYQGVKTNPKKSKRHLLLRKGERGEREGGKRKEGGREGGIKKRKERRKGVREEGRRVKFLFLFNFD